MGKLVARAKAWFARLRRRRPFVDHVVRTVQHFGAVRGSILSGGITYFGFLSVFPILALAFFVVGYISEYFPNADDALQTAINQVLPGIVTTQDPPPAGQISFAQIEATRNIAGVLGALGVLYTGLGFVSNLRTSVSAAFDVPTARAYGFLPGKLRDLATLVLVGVVMMLSVGVSGAVTRYTGDLLDEVGVQSTPVSAVVSALTIAIGLMTATLLFFLLYKLLVRTTIPDRALWRGAFLAATGFEIVKQLASYILSAAAGGALASLALSVTLLVWIYYFAQLVIYGASWAATAQASRERGVVIEPHVVPAFGGADIGPAGAVPSAALTAERDEAVATSRALLVIGGLVVAGWAWVRHDKGRSAGHGRG